MNALNWAELDKRGQKRWIVMELRGASNRVCEAITRNGYNSAGVIAMIREVTTNGVLSADKWPLADRFIHDEHELVIARGMSNTVIEATDFIAHHVSECSVMQISNLLHVVTLCEEIYLLILADDSGNTWLSVQENLATLTGLVESMSAQETPSGNAGDDWIEMIVDIQRTLDILAETETEDEESVENSSGMEGDESTEDNDVPRSKFVDIEAESRTGSESDVSEDVECGQRSPPNMDTCEDTINSQWEETQRPYGSMKRERSMDELVDSE